MKKLTLLIGVFLFTISLAACGSNSEPNQDDSPSNTVDTGENDDIEVFSDDKNEVETYIIEAKKLYSELMTLLERYEELQGVVVADEIDDHEFASFLNDEIIPTNNKIREDIKAIHAPNEQTVKANELLMDAVGNQQTAFTEILLAIESGESIKTITANERLDDSRKSADHFVNKIEQLLIDYDIE